MERLDANLIEYINNFCNMSMDANDITPITHAPKKYKFLNNDICKKYLGNMFKDIDVRLYLAYLDILNEKIKFISDFNVENSICAVETICGVTQSVNIKVPDICNGMDILVTAHELGHGLKSVTKINNDRFLHTKSIFNETISILFGKICLERYTNDFGFDIYAQKFEIMNIKNAVNCLSWLKNIFSDYIYKENKFCAKVKNGINLDEYRKLSDEVEKLQSKIIMLISYPIGLSLANVYDNFNKEQKRDYLTYISRYLLNIKQIDFEMILEYFNIPFEAKFYGENMQEYIDKFKSKYSRVKTLGGDR